MGFVWQTQQTGLSAMAGTSVHGLDEQGAAGVARGGKGLGEAAGTCFAAKTRALRRPMQATLGILI